MNIPITRVSLGKEEISYVNEVLSSGYLVKGKFTNECEVLLAKKCKRKYAVMLTSGTVSLNTSTTILDLKPDDEVITSAFTFVASATAISYVHAKMVLADIDPTTFNVDPREVERKITKKTKAIIAIDLFGHPFDYYRLRSISKKNSLYLIEDAAQAHGGVFKGRPVGSLGDISIFSFYGSKIITSGEGGMLLTDNKKLYERALSYRAHGESKEKKYYFTDLGYNFMPTDIQAALLLPQIKRLSKLVKMRNKVARYYSKLLKGIEGIEVPLIQKGITHAFAYYTIRIKPEFGKRDEVLEKLNARGIGARIYYPFPMHLQPVWKKLGYKFKKGEFPQAEKASREVISLPIYPKIKRSELDFIIDTLDSIL